MIVFEFPKLHHCIFVYGGHVYVVECNIIIHVAMYLLNLCCIMRKWDLRNKLAKKCFFMHFPYIILF